MPRRASKPAPVAEEAVEPAQPLASSEEEDVTGPVIVKPLKPPTFGRALVDAGLIRDGLSDREIKARLQEACAQSGQHIIARRHLLPLQVSRPA